MSYPAWLTTSLSSGERGRPTLQVADLLWWRRPFRLRLRASQAFLRARRQAQRPDKLKHVLPCLADDLAIFGRKGPPDPASCGSTLVAQALPPASARFASVSPPSPPGAATRQAEACPTLA